MRIEALRRADVDRGVGAQALAHEMGVHCACRQDHGNCRKSVGDALVGQDQMGVALSHRVLGLEADAIDRAGKCAVLRLSVAHLEDAVDLVEAAFKTFLQALIHAGGDHRTLQREDLRLLLVLRQHIAEVAEPRLQAHHAGFAQRIDGRIGHLAEILAEVMRQRPVFFGEDGQRRVVAHRANGLLAVLDHRMKDQLEVFDRKSGGDLASAQLVLREQARLGARPDHRLQVDDVLRPFLIGVLACEPVLDGAVFVEAAFLQIERNHLPGTDAALAHHMRVVERDQPGLRAAEEKTVVGDRVALRPQSVAVHAGDHPAPIRRRQRGWPVPRLHHCVRIGVHGAVRLRHCRCHLRPGFGHEDRLGQRRGAAGADHHFEHCVERRRVRAARLDDGLDVVAFGPEQIRRHLELVVLHPVDVAFQRVDLAVVREHPERLGQPPSRERVGRVALVKDREGRDEALVLEVGVEVRELLGQEHAFVDQRARGERADVEILDRRFAHALLDAAATEVEPPVQGFEILRVARVEHELLDLGPRRVRLVADDRDVDRHLAPAIDLKTRAQDLGLDDRAAGFLRAVIRARQEDLPDRDASGPDAPARAFDGLAEEVLRHL